MFRARRNSVSGGLLLTCGHRMTLQRRVTEIIEREQVRCDRIALRMAGTLTSLESDPHLNTSSPIRRDRRVPPRYYFDN